VRDGRWLVGMGVASAFRNNLVQKSAARVRLDSKGMVTVETDMTDIGTGSYTIIAQTAAEMMGVPLTQVVVRSAIRFPVSAGSGGQWGGNSSTAGVYAACVKLREAVAQKLGLDQREAEFSHGQVRGRPQPAAGPGRGRRRTGGRGHDGIRRPRQEIPAVDLWRAFRRGGVDAATARCACAACWPCARRAASSTQIGAQPGDRRDDHGRGRGLDGGAGRRPARGFFVNHDLASYEVPVHADIPHQEVIFLDETDPISSPMKAKGVGELGICGVAAAVANAVYNATGVRVRDYPITLDKLIAKLPA
jgi:xanthine dehydrogenase YagR molybdenum-binding subunit